MKYVYKYDEKTKEYLGKAEALLDPLETQLQQKEIYLLPADATFSAPALQEGYVSVFKEGAWENIEDNRDKEYWLQDDVYGTPARKMETLGALPADAVFSPPQKTLEQVKQAKLAEISQWTADNITGGFISSASGEPVRYDSDVDTQLTMQGIALNVGTPLFAEKYPDGCPVRGVAEGKDSKAVYLLNPQQVMQWMADLSMHIGSCKQAGWAKQAEVNACKTVAEVDAIKL